MDSKLYNPFEIRTGYRQKIIMYPTIIIMVFDGVMNRITGSARVLQWKIIRHGLRHRLC